MVAAVRHHTRFVVADSLPVVADSLLAEADIRRLVVEDVRILVAGAAGHNLVATAVAGDIRLVAGHIHREHRAVLEADFRNGLGVVLHSPVHLADDHPVRPWCRMKSRSRLKAV